ncbi:hypothetical protein BDZ88DRAFT_431931 [Geranomyces variabilis]|nr:hypothetical protein BDZ88DRAFT_431931 [Geranomyces variabilis]KAJ3142744.1 hypothetical protein HDU90_002615 [Geranomyces variabilis]
MLFISSALFALVVLSEGAAAAIARNCTTNFNAGANVDYFVAQKAAAASIPAGSNVAITYPAAGNYKIVEDKFSNLSYVLYQCGTTKPTTNLPANVAGVFEIPVQAIITTSTTELNFLELLDARSTIKYTTDTGLITSPCVVKAALPALASKSGTLSTDETAAWTAATAATNLTIVGYYDTVTPSATNRDVKFPATNDQSATLSRADWLYFLAAFYNQEPLAKSLVDQITTSYNCISTAAKSSAATLGSPDAYWASGFGGVLYNGSPYVKAYLASAGGTASQVGALDTGAASSANYNISQAADVTALDIVLKNSELFFTDAVASLDAWFGWTGLKTTDISAYNVTRAGQIWSADKQSSAVGTGSGWFNGAVVNLHVVLADIASIVQPGLFGSSYTRTYFRNIAQGEKIVPVAASQCADVDAASTLPAITCPSAITSKSVAGAVDWAGAGEPAYQYPGGAGRTVGASLALAVMGTLVASMLAI